jgi:hypothetical protein
VGPTVFIFVCASLFSASIFLIFCAYQFGKYQGWVKGWREHAQYKNEVLTLKQGETFLGVVDTERGSYLFTSIDARNGSNYE